MKKSIITILVMAIACLGLMIALPSCTNSSKHTSSLTIIHINDTHGRTHAEPHIAALANELRQKNENVLILDAGDRIHGQVATNLTTGESMVDLMNLVGYNAMAVGNHDFQFGIDRLQELASGYADFPFLSANVVGKNGDLLFEAYKIFKFSDIKVGVFGITTPETLQKADPRTIHGLTFLCPATVAEDMAATLKAKGSDIVIALTHLGNASDTLQNNSSFALTKIDAIDIIIDGHSHELLPFGLVKNSTLITQAGQHAGHIGIIKVELKNNQAPTFNASTLQVSELKNPCQELLLAINTIDDLLDPIVSTVIGYSPYLLNGNYPDVRGQETNLSNLITDSMRHATGADIAFLTGGNIRYSIQAGEITLRDALDVLPFANNLVTIDVSGELLLQILEHGISNYPNYAGSFIHVSGLIVTFDPTLPAGNRIISAALLCDTPINPSQTYTIATIEFLAAGGDGYTMLNYAKNLTYFGGDVQAFADYLLTNPTISAIPDSRLRAVLSS